MTDPMLLALPIVVALLGAVLSVTLSSVVNRAIIARFHKSIDKMVADHLAERAHQELAVRVERLERERD